MVKVYSKNDCIQCKMTKRFLSEHNIEFIEHNVTESPEYLGYLKSKGFRSVPIIENNGSFIVGFNIPELNKI